VGNVRATEVWNQSNEGVILIPQQKIAVEEIPNTLQDILFNNIPVLLVKQSCKAIRSWGFS
jgi:hypothetical protein